MSAPEYAEDDLTEVMGRQGVTLGLLELAVTSLQSTSKDFRACYTQWSSTLDDENYANHSHNKELFMENKSEVVEVKFTKPVPVVGVLLQVPMWFLL